MAPRAGRKIHALVVGGTRGLGRVLVRRLAEKGYVVSVIGRHTPPSAARIGRSVHYFQADLGDRRQIPAVLDKVWARNGRLHSLVFFQRFRGEGDAWLGEFETSLTATKEIIERSSDRFALSGGRSIVVVTSIAGRFVADEQPASYHVSKSALDQLVRYFAVRLGPRKIRVNAVAPATVIKEESRAFFRKNRRLLALYARIIPLGRMGTAEEVAGTIEFLCSEGASYITGQTITVDGGLSLRGQESLARQVASLDHIPVTREARRK